MKAKLKPFSRLNALHSLRSGLFNLAFEVLLPFKLNLSWSVVTYFTSYVFRRDVEIRAYPWEYGLAFLHFISCLHCFCSKAHSHTDLWILCYCFSTKSTRTSKVNTLKGHLHPAVSECRSRCVTLVPLRCQGDYHHFLRFWVY